MSLLCAYLSMCLLSLRLQLSICVCVSLSLSLSRSLALWLSLSLSLTGASVMKVIASDADDPTYGSSARVVYSVLEEEKIFTVERHTGQQHYHFS